MRLRSVFSLLTLSLATTLAAHADTVETFSFSGTSFTNGAVSTGNISIDTSIGSFTGANFLYTPATGASLLFNAVSRDATPLNNDTQVYADFTDGTGDYIALDLPVANLIGYAGSTVCNVNAPCPGGYDGGFGDVNSLSAHFTGGSLVVAPAIAATPEPSSLILLATGTLGAAGALRRRLA